MRAREWDKGRERKKKGEDGIKEAYQLQVKTLVHYKREYDNGVAARRGRYEAWHLPYHANAVSTNNLTYITLRCTPRSELNYYGKMLLVQRFVRNNSVGHVG